MDLKSIFGCHSVPFTREVRIEDLFLLPFFEEAREGLTHAVEKRSMAALIAPPGSGKTTVLRAVRARLAEARYSVHYVKCTDISKREMCREIAVACSLKTVGSFPMLLRRVQERFETLVGESGQRPVLFLDEAHDLRPDVLNMLRVLTNFEMDSRLVLAVVLTGQPGLATMLEREELDAIARRIIHYATLRPLSRDETAKYVELRMTAAGARQSPFDGPSLEAIFEIGRGSLRLTDSLALGSLEIAAEAKLQTVGTQHVAAARRRLFPC